MNCRGETSLDDVNVLSDPSAMHRDVKNSRDLEQLGYTTDTWIMPSHSNCAC